jgi:hypothetical protein
MLPLQYSNSIPAKMQSLLVTPRQIEEEENLENYPPLHCEALVCVQMSKSRCKSLMIVFCGRGKVVRLGPSSLLTAILPLINSQQLLVS